MAPSNVQDIYKLSPVQQGMLFHVLYAPESGAYFDQFVYPHPEVDRELLRRVWQQVVARHTALRTSFLWEDLDEPVQIVHREAEVPIEEEDWSAEWPGLSPTERQQKISGFLRRDRARGFDLHRPPLMRLTSLHTGDGKSLMVWSYHHLVLDGWSVNRVIWREIVTLFAAESRRTTAKLPPARPFREYIRWLRQQDLARAESYWRRTLAGMTSATPLGIEPLAGENGEGELAWQRLELSASEQEAIQGLARTSRITFPVLIQAAWALVLGRASGQDDVVYGLTVSGRPPAIRGVEEMVGCFINTLPVRVRVPPGAALGPWLGSLHRQLAELRSYEHSPLAEVQKWSGVAGGRSLFDNIVVFEGFGEGAAEGASLVETHQRTNYPLVLAVVPHSQGLRLALGYDDARFAATAVRRRVAEVAEMVRCLVAEPDVHLGELPALPAAHRQQLLVEWNEPRPDYAGAGLVHELIEAQADRTPEAVAAVSEAGQLSYGELERRANRLAHRLRGLGVGPESLVGVCLERSLELAVTLLGILKAGGAYVPLDPAYPRDRLAFMAADAGLAIVITEERLAGFVPPGPRLLLLDRDGGAIAAESAERPRPAATADNPIYVIYTSGSTGRPKGAVVCHGAVANRMYYDVLELDASVRFQQLSPISFDMLLNQLFSPLVVGGRSVIVKAGGEKDTAYLTRRIAEQGVTHAGFARLLLGLVIEDDAFPACQSLRHVVTGGEAVPSELPPRFHERLAAGRRAGHPPPRLFNRYGPTETTVAVTSWTCRADVRERVLPIGRPLAKAEIYLVDRRLKPVPFGVQGELYVGGPCLARGYLGRGGRTAASFLPNPFLDPASGRRGERLYRTGDLARYRDDGAIEFIGRIDQQVKIRGYRIELGEIEAVIRRHEAVADVAVIDLDHGATRKLAAYVVPSAGVRLDGETLRAFLRDRLPDYMVPSAFTALDALPLLPNGKVNRRALPAPQWETGPPAGRVAPRDAVEAKLAEIWAEVLKRSEVGIYDNYFELGGDSILSIGIVHRANKAGLRLTPRQLFEHQTIAELATAVGRGVEVDAEQGAVTGEVPLTPIQRHFFAAGFADPHHFNQALVLDVRRPLAARVLRRGLAAVVAQHDALRLRFTREDGEWRQRHAPPGEEVPWATIDLARVATPARAMEQAAARLQASLDLGGPILRAALVDLGEAGRRLLLVIHHLVVDGVSWRILIEDLETACRALEAGAKPDLGAKTTSFKRWAEHLVERVAAGDVDADLPYWRRLAEVDAAPLPVDREDGANTVGSVDKVTVTLDAGATRALLAEAHAAYRTEVPDLLLTALAVTLGRFAGGPLLVALEGHGREPWSDEIDLSRTVGWLTALYPVALEAAPEAGLEERLKAVKETLRAVPRRGLGFGLLRYLGGDDVRAELAALPRPQVVFNYLGRFGGDAEGAGDTLFAPTAEATGPVQSPAAERTVLLAVNGLVAGDRLRLEWSFSTNRHEHATVERLAESYVAELAALVAHCCRDEVFGYTPSDFPLAGLGQQALDRALAGRRHVEALYPLSPMQEGMLFHSLAAPASGMYFEQRSFTLDGAVDAGAFERAWRVVVRRHASLRVAVLWRDLPRPLQAVHGDVDLRFDRHRWDDVRDAADEAGRLEGFLAADRARGFALDRAPLLRLAWITVPGAGGGERHHLVWSFHHLVMDGWSGPVVQQEVLAVYEALSRGAEPRLPPAPSYERFVAWLERRRAEAGKDAESFWREYLKGFTAATPLASRRARRRDDALRAGDLRTRWRPLPAPVHEALEELARRARVTLNTVVQGAWAVLLGRGSGEDDVVFGVTVSGRPAELADVERIVGVFINTLPARARLVDDDAALPWLERLQSDRLAMEPYETTPLVAVQGWSQVPRGQPLFESLVLYESYPSFAGDGGGAGAPALAIRRGEGFERTNYPLTLFVSPHQGALRFGLAFDARELEPATVERQLAQLVTWLGGLAAAPGRRLGELPLLAAGERHQLLVETHAARRRFPPAPLPALLAAQAARRPRAVAAACGDDELTYAELAGRVTGLAHRLRARGVSAEARVGVCCERSLDMLVAVLGVLEAGGAYVPLDPSYPRERIAYVLEDAAVAVLVTQEDLVDTLPAVAAPRLVLDRDAAADQGPPLPPPDPDQLAYVIYTSGSTGKPKGVQISHGALSGFLQAMAGRSGFGEDDALLAVTTLSFDIAALELYLPLIAGGRVVIAPREATVHGGRLAELFERSGATTLQATPATWRLLLEAPWPGPEGAGGRRLWCGGEALPRDLADRLLATGGELWNLYGPTEATIWSAACKVPPGRGPVPVAGPLANNELYVVDRRLRPVALGCPGELVLGGEGLARGYFGRPALTAERFVPSPFAGRRGERLYRTGDLVRPVGAGEVEFLGRIDHQVKVRGFRIELGEIEAALAAVPEIRELAVAVRDDGGDRRLVAFLAAREGAAIPPATELRRALRTTLPEYMVPASFVTLDALPLTPNGKIDRKALGKMALQRREAPGAAAPPSSEIERVIAAAWKEVLEVEEVGLDDNFFDLGGHSLLAMRVHDALRERLGLGERDLGMIDLFQNPTVRTLARALAEEAPAAVRATRRRGAVEETAIAVVGMAGRFPGAASVGELWENLLGGVESIRFHSREELLAAGLPESLVDDPGFVPAGAGMDDADLFDAAFFDYAPREAQLIDPQQRIFLECAWEALEDAGYDPSRIAGEVGVYAGAGINTYLFNLASHPELLQAVGNFQAFISNDKDFLPTRVSYKLDLRGPSVNVQTACSTSLVATTLACEALVRGQADLALAGGVSVNPGRRWGYLYREGGISSPDGHTRAFDARAAGAVFGDGSAAVVLKRLADAQADGDTIHAVLRGWAINNDGALKVGFTAPSVDGQAKAVAEALAMAGFEPATIGYVETHGTATELGDPIEVTALKRAFGEVGERAVCGLGSVKSNIGHVDTAAGAAGLIKTVLALEHGELPPSLHFEAPNPLLGLDDSPFYVVGERRPWPRRDGLPRRAGVSSFGIGGTNAHLVLEEAPEPTPELAPSAETRPYQLLLVSARSGAALDQATGRLAGHLERRDDVALADVAHTLQVGRKRFAYRRMLVARDRDDAVAALGERDGERLVSERHEAEERPVVFLFPGGGAQYPGMGRDLYETEPLFRREIDRAAELVAPHLGFDIRDDLYPAAEREEEAAALLRRTSHALPALFATCHALARLWTSWGIRPRAMIGHSLGEYVAACLAEVLSLEDALAIVAVRGQLFERLPEGGMLSVPLPLEELAPLLGDELSVAAVNTPSLAVASGANEAIDALAHRLAERGVEASRLHIDVAAHSHLVDPILAPFAEAVAGLELRPPKIPFVSNVTGTWITADEATDPSYWPRQLRQTVRFAEGLGELFAEPGRILLEVGPGQTLGTLARQHPDKTAAGVLTSLRHPREPRSDVEYQLYTLGRLWLLGATVDWDGFYRRGTPEAERRRRVPLPTYPFERKRYWIEGQGLAPVGGRSDGALPLAPPPAVEEASAAEGDFETRVAPRTPLERRLAEIWQVFLGVEALGVHDNFFELGGSSLLAVQLRARLRREYDVELPPQFLLEAPTVARLAALLEGAGGGGAGDEERPASSSLVVLAPGDAARRRPLYLMHPVGGHVYFYRALAGALGEAQPVVGLQARGFEDDAAPHTSIEDLAADYLTAIRQRQSSGPYLLGGSSMGGTIAFEMARQLRAAGEAVDLLVMMDTPGPGHLPKPSSDDAELLVRLYGDRLPMSVDELRALAPDDQLRRVLETARAAGALPDEFDLDDARRHLDVVKVLLDAYTSYRHRPYDGPVLFFRARERRAHEALHPELGWFDLVRGTEVHVVAGNHLTMFHPEHVGEMAAILRQRLDRLAPLRR